MTVTTLTRSFTFVVAAALPSAGAPTWDAACSEWVLTDTDGISYCGDTPTACERQFLEALHVAAAHYRKNP